jgi:hypothetical protein
LEQKTWGRKILPFLRSGLFGLYSICVKIIHIVNAHVQVCLVLLFLWGVILLELCESLARYLLMLLFDLHEWCGVLTVRKASGWESERPVRHQATLEF